MVFCPVRIDTQNSIRPISGMVYREIIVVYCKNDCKYTAWEKMMKMAVGIITTGH
jgi:hypothetical protein